MADSWPALPAAAIGFAGLLPSLPKTADPNPALALAGVAGAAAVLVLAERRPRCTMAAVAGGLALAALLLPAALTAIGDARLSAASPERTDLVRVALAQVGAAPLTGVGPGRLDLAYLDHRGIPVLAQYVHQEYLQLAAETGLVGLGLVLAGATALTAGAVHRRGRPAAHLPTAALAVLAAFGVHSAFDFLWHIPVLPLLVVLAAVALVPVHHHTHEQEIP
jgi:O-antigen ligase